MNASEENKMLMLVDGTINENESAQDYVQLDSSYNPQQFVVQGNCDMDMESFGDLLSNQGITLRGEDLSVIEQDGQRYIVLPNVSVAQVMQTDTVTTQSNTEANLLSYVPPQVLEQTTDNQNIHASADPLAFNKPTEPMQNETNTFEVTSSASNIMDIQRIFPSLCSNPDLSANILNNLHCFICNFKAGTEAALEEHMEEHRNSLGEKIYVGSKEISVRKRKVKRGRKKRNTCKFIRTIPPPSEQNKGPFLCSICGAQINMISLYKRHMKGHLNEKAFKCDLCPDTFNMESNLTLHRALHAERCENGYKCPVCHRSFMRIASLKSHLSLHLVDETMICTECGDEFALKSELDLHMEQHRRDLQVHLDDRVDRTIPPHHNIDELLNSDGDEIFTKNRKRSRKKADPQQCMFCDKIFQKGSQFKRHVLIHTGEKPYSCTLCEKSFNQSGALKMHMMMHSGNKPYTCPHCPQIYTQRGNLRLHLTRAHSSVNSFPCAECSCIFKKLGSLNAHMTKYHKGFYDQQNAQVLPSTIDDVSGNEVVISNKEDENDNRKKKEIDVIQQLLQSLDDDETNDQNIVDATSVNFLSGDLENDIVQQALQDSGVKPTEKMTTSHDEVSHNSTETTSIEDELKATEIEIEDGNTADATEGLSEISKRSGVSGVYMRTSGMGREHTWRVRRINGVRWHQCMYCAKEFKKPSDLVRHIRIHTRERPYVCVTCHKSFAVKTSLTSHEKIHLGYKPYKCQVCSKSFSTSGSLKVHIRLHTGARPFKCSQCDLSFRTTGHRHNHMLSHLRGTAHKRLRKPRKEVSCFFPNSSLPPLDQPVHLLEDGSQSQHNNNIAAINGSRDHNCVICRKSFKKLSHLKQHMRSHTGERPYCCTQCGKSFISSSILKAHMRVHSGHKPFHCLHCGQLFRTNHTLKRHMTIHSQSRPYMCPYCQKTFKTNATCKKHIETHRNEVTQTEICGQTQSNATQSTINADAILQFGNFEPQTADIRTQENNGQCDVIMNSNPTAMTADDVTVASNDIIICTSDETIGTNVSTMVTDDVTMDFNVNPALLQIDPNIIQDINQLSRYKVSEEVEPTPFGDNGDKPAEEDMDSYKCMGCFKHFESKAHLQHHDESEKDSNMFPCTICCHSMECEQSQLSHINSHSSDDIHQCPICFVTFDDENIMKSHQDAHPMTEKYICVVRDEGDKDVANSNHEENVKKAKETKRKRSGFYRLSEEQSEILERTDPSQTMTLSERILLSAVAEKDKVSLAQKPGTRGRYKEYETNGPIHPNACRFCPKSFRKPSDLTRHIRTHTGDKPFKCGICNKSFAIKSTLKCHEKCHEQKKTFRCHICDMMYSAKASLKVHMRLHTGSKPYKCPHCTLTFRTSGHRKSHMTTHFVQPNKPIEASTTGTKVSTGNITSSREDTTTTTSKSNPVPITWPDMTLTLPVETFLTTNIFQENGATQATQQNLQINNDEQNITFQIDPVLLQQSLEQNSTSQPMLQVGMPETSNNSSWPPPNVVIQPINNICLQPLPQVPPPGGQLGRGLQEINIAVPSSLAGITQQLLQSPVEANKRNDDVNSTTIIQAVQQFLGNLQTSSGNQHRLSENLIGGQDVTLTINANDVINSQGIVDIQRFVQNGDGNTGQLPHLDMAHQSERIPHEDSEALS